MAKELARVEVRVVRVDLQVLMVPDLQRLRQAILRKQGMYGAPGQMVPDNVEEDRFTVLKSDEERCTVMSAVVL